MPSLQDFAPVGGVLPACIGAYKVARANFKKMQLPVHARYQQPAPPAEEASRGDPGAGVVEDLLVGKEGGVPLLDDAVAAAGVYFACGWW